MKGGTAADYVTHMAQYGKPEVATAYTKRSCDNGLTWLRSLANGRCGYYRNLSAKIRQHITNI